MSQPKGRSISVAGSSFTTSTSTSSSAATRPGRSSGSATRRKRCQRGAPSRRADSSSEGRSAWKAVSVASWPTRRKRAHSASSTPATDELSASADNQGAACSTATSSHIAPTASTVPGTA
ncbi:MAG: hypothetical protein A2X76_08290 [Lysobacterales bacterium GWF1_69_6]|nr:MAG: hypothetical protein A2X76_08290 [Xanthomonadales bacterium GWF1_69_6]